MTQQWSEVPILVVTGTDPLEQNHGALMRLRVAIAALQKIAPVEVAVITAIPDDPALAGANPLPLGVSRLARFTFTRNLRIRDRARWLLLPKQPLALVGREYTEMRNALRRWLAPQYSLVWVFRTGVYHAVWADLPTAPVIVDIDDLESEKISAHLMQRRGRLAGGLATRIRTFLALSQGRRNVRAWLEFDRRVAHQVAGVVVCSEDDRSILGAANAVVVPNCYPEPPEHRARGEGARTILLQGSLTYDPNVDGAQFFVCEIFPKIQREISNISVRLVGRASPLVRELGSMPGVVVTGYVDDIETELQRADLVVAPIRYGGGTRIKIIEAFAHGVPVVATSAGAHGLGLTNGVQLLLADDPNDFASACVRLLTETQERNLMVAAARSHYRRYFTRTAAEGTILRLAGQAVHAIE